MKPVIPIRRKVLAFAVGVTFIHPAHAAWPVIDAAVVAAVSTVNASITALNASVTSLLYNIGTAINQNGQKTVSTIEAASKIQRDFATVQETNRRLEDARQRYDIPASICAESAAGGATEVMQSATSARTGLRPGGGAAISSSAIAGAINKPPVTQEADAARASHIHTKYCDTDDYAAYGGARACPAISPNMPGADKRFDTILDGAGPEAKRPDLTFSQEQSDVARMYIQNSVRRSVGPQLRKAEADTPAGIQYVGLMNQYNAIISAAAEPQEQRIADSQPNPATRALLADALTTPSANAYYRLIASPRAKVVGMMSMREFEMFEVGRRYANTDYQTDLQAMSGDNLLRELIRVVSLNNWIAMSLKNEIQKGNMIGGLTLASAARREFEPILHQKYQSVPGQSK
ncbi:conjugal transfer protein TraW [Massilia sp. NR 4-1]|uniref:conjugal transfer protein TraW n=1 Tax=Massilia sp. NR 4-1 TaxID=1678028 RepID=UPI00067C2D24|nr:conjugal transfer protein TraW [Massilia sp. NR 4-1]AKU21210.1 conjugal transfer protein TraW [Massilia sp. NR 4-1]